VAGTVAVALAVVSGVATVFSGAGFSGAGSIGAIGDDARAAS
jgi:hypothetical protein